MTNDREKQMANEIANAINVMGIHPTEFCKAMGREHPTLQEDFTNICVHWLKYASDQYKTGDWDARNELGCKAASMIVDGTYPW